MILFLFAEEYDVHYTNEHRRIIKAGGSTFMTVYYVTTHDTIRSQKSWIQDKTCLPAKAAGGGNESIRQSAGATRKPKAEGRQQFFAVKWNGASNFDPVYSGLLFPPNFTPLAAGLCILQYRNLQVWLGSVMKWERSECEHHNTGQHLTASPFSVVKKTRSSKQCRR